MIFVLSEGVLCESLVYDFWVFMPVVDIYPHLFVWLARPRHVEEVVGALVADLSECTQTCQNASSYPRAILSFRWRKDLNPHVLDRQSLYLM